jgi:hypothetical protein
MVIFFQLDVTGRSESDPAALNLVTNLFSYVASWTPPGRLSAVYTGEAAGKEYLTNSSIVADHFKGKPADDQLLIAGPGSGKYLTPNLKSLSKWLNKGGRMLVLGQESVDLMKFFPDVETKSEEHIAGWFEPPGRQSLFAGIGPADIHNRAPLTVSKITNGAEQITGGVLAVPKNSNCVICQLAPWKLDYGNEKHNVKQTFRRTAYLVNRLLANMGVSGNTPVLSRFNSPVSSGEKRWLEGLYLDIPEEWDDPYRFFRW